MRVAALEPIDPQCPSLRPQAMPDVLPRLLESLAIVRFVLKVVLGKAGAVDGVRFGVEAAR